MWINVASEGEDDTAASELGVGRSTNIPSLSPLPSEVIRLVEVTEALESFFSARRFNCR